jgi:formate hydrogenlyase transcriptional activator
MAASSVAEVGLSAATRYEALIRISNSIRAHKEPGDLFDILVHELRKVIPFDAIAQFDESSNKINWHLGPSCKDHDACPSDLEGGESLPRMVYRTQETVVVSALAGASRFPEFTRKMRAKGLQSVCAVPLTTAHRRLGSLLIGSTQVNAYSQEEVEFCTLVADQIALATDDAINFEASRKAQERLELLLDLTTRVVSNLNLRDVIREISAQVRRVMRCDAVAVDLPSPEDGKLRLYAFDLGGSLAAVEEGQEPTAGEKSAPALAFRTGEAVIHSGEEIQDESIREAGIQSVVHVPMAGRGGIVGVLSLGTLREGAFSANDLPFLMQVANQVAIAIENARTFDEVSDQKNKLTLEKLYLEDELRTELKFEEIIGRSEALRRVLEQIETVSPTDSTVLIYGETGSGKELIARAVHNLSARKKAAFVKLNCAALPTGLLESELFGHEKGAFTGAISQRIGRFELANRGTMFLDEIGDVALELQPKLLRVLQEREFERLGSPRTLRTDARLIAATNRDLEALVKEQKFRPDLYYRLNVFPVRVPSLRERPEDIPLLVRHFVQQYSRQMGKTIDAIPAETMSALTRYPWPGNIRELQNVIERAVILTTGPVLSVRSDDLREPNHTQTLLHPAAGADSASSNVNMRDALEGAERQQIVAALEKSNWIVAGPEGAAARLGLKRSTLQSRMQKLGIRVSRTGA